MNAKLKLIGKVVHKAHLIEPGGNVSALCFVRPRPIDLRRETWTLVPEDTTCEMCKLMIAASPVWESRQVDGPEEDDFFTSPTHRYRIWNDYGAVTLRIDPLSGNRGRMQDYPSREEARFAAERHAQLQAVKHERTAQ